MTDAPYRLSGPRRRPAGKFILRPLDSRDGWKGRASYLADNLASGYSHQAGGYVLSPTAARDFETLYAAGFTGGIRGPRQPAVFSHDEREIPRISRREALRLAAEWAVPAIDVNAYGGPYLTIVPTSEAGADWCADHINALLMAGRYLCEHRYGPDILLAAHNAGLTVALDGQVADVPRES